MLMEHPKNNHRRHRSCLNFYNIATNSTASNVARKSRASSRLHLHSSIKRDSRFVVVVLLLVLWVFQDSVESLKMPPTSWRNLPPYHSQFGFGQAQDAYSSASSTSTADTSNATSSQEETKTYSAQCYCGRVKYEVRGEPTSSKLCHCRGCQQLHGAPFEWVSIFHKHNVRFEPESLDFLYFYSGAYDQGWDASHAEERSLPVKVSCSWCRTPIADEGRNMWLAFSTLFGFTVETGIPESFQHTNHLFYGQRCIELNDEKVKWRGHKNKSAIYKDKDSS